MNAVIGTIAAIATNREAATTAIVDYTIAEHPQP
jgi:hypothetical protein